MINEKQGNGFYSILNFFDDLIKVSESLKDADPKIISLRNDLQKINAQLPSAIYIPF